MKHPLLPDFDFDTYNGVTPSLIKELGRSCILCDIDNTLVPYDIPEPTAEVRLWIENMKSEGIDIVLVSNNGKERVEKFNASLGLPYLYKSKKPLPSAVKKGSALAGKTKNDVVMLGDQLLTDVLTARTSGIPALWVPSIKKVETPFFRFKSAIEKPFIKHYYNKKGIKK